MSDETMQIYRRHRISVSRDTIVTKFRNMMYHLIRNLLCFMIPAYLSMSALISTNDNGEVSWIRINTGSDESILRINSWLRYWVVMAVLSLPKLFLDRIKIIPHYNLFKTLFILWCLVPGSFGGTDLIFYQIYPLFKVCHESAIQLISETISVILNNLLVADIAAGVVFVVDILSSMENPGNTFVMLCGCLYLFQTLLQLIKPEKKEENISLRMTVDRVDDTPMVEHNTLTQKIKQKSKKIVMDAEKGEAKMAIEKCKKFLTAVQSSNFQCKIFINSWEDIEGKNNFDKIVTNIGAQLKLPKEDVEGIKLAAMGGSSKRDYLAFDCAMKEKGEVRLHTGGYSVVQKDYDKYDFQIVHHFIDLNELTLKKIPAQITEEEPTGWFRRQSQPQLQAIEMEHPEEGKDWNTYFQYEAHKNLLKELPEEEEQ